MSELGRLDRNSPSPPSIRWRSLRDAITNCSKRGSLVISSAITAGGVPAVCFADRNRSRLLPKMRRFSSVGE